MPDLWHYKPAALLRAARELQPATVRVHLLSGLYAVAEQPDGSTLLIREASLTRRMTLDDAQR